MPLADEYEERARAEAPETEVALDEDGEDAEGEGEAIASRTPTPERPLQMAVVGRPNAGKSTLINTILGEDRLLTGPEAGITRDAISLQTGLGRAAGKRMFDTAGMRKKGARSGQAREAVGLATGCARSSSRKW